MKKLTDAQVNEVCGAISIAAGCLVTKDNKYEDIYCNIHHYGHLIKRLSNLIRHGYAEIYTYDQIKDVYEINELYSLNKKKRERK